MGFFDFLFEPDFDQDDGLFSEPDRSRNKNSKDKSRNGLFSDYELDELEEMWDEL